MKTIKASKERATMSVIEVAEKFCAAWSSPDAEAFGSLFAPDGYYTDIAFGVTRRGRESVGQHHKIWRMAVPEFSMMLEHAHASGQVVTVQTICYGKFSGSDLGGGKIKATHKSFRARSIVVLEINDRAEITACTEYYDRTTMPIGEPTPFNDLTWP
jgi:ketosteroid isomerase-like protein